MPFPESIKLEVKRKAAFRCCRCQAIGIEIHHIVPQFSGGPNTFENAAPLCSKCHSDFGDNPAKQKEIREMRDWWYDTVKDQFHGPKIDPRYASLDEKLDRLLQVQSDSDESLSQIKAVLSAYTSLLIEQTTRSSIHNLAQKVADIQKPFHGGSPCEMSGQQCPGCHKGIVDVAPGDLGVECNECGLFIPA